MNSNIIHYNNQNVSEYWHIKYFLAMIDVNMAILNDSQILRALLINICIYLFWQLTKVLDESLQLPLKYLRNQKYSYY